MENLSNLKQDGLLEDYKNKFDILALKVQNLPEAHKLTCFLGWLKEEIRLPVWMFHLKNFVGELLFPTREDMVGRDYMLCR